MATCMMCHRTQRLTMVSNSANVACTKPAYMQHRLGFMLHSLVHEMASWTGV